jgi:hypothetical protein
MMRRIIAGVFLVVTLVTAGASVIMPQYAFATDPPPAYQDGGTGGQAGQADFVDGKTFDPYAICSGWLSIGCSISIAIVYGMWFRFTHFLAEGSAYVADQVLFLSLQSDTYRAGDLMTQGWVAVRDFVNVGFIIALLYVGFQFISGNGSSKNILIKIILSALLVNFSLYGARFMIDLGNIVARSLYTHIKVVNVSVASTQSDADNGESSGRVSVSAAILEATNPQGILFNQYQDEIESGSGSDSLFWTVTVIYFMTGLLNIFLIIMFGSMAILFLSRTVGLIMLAIIVPISIVVDLIDPVKKAVSGAAGKFSNLLSFDSWLSEFAKLSATAPIYVFFLYIIIMLKSSIIDAKTVSVGLGSGGMMMEIVKMMLPTIMIFFFLRMASKITQDMAGTVGSQISAGVSKAVGFVGGIALGAAGGLAARAGGAGAQKMFGGLAGMSADERKSKQDGYLAAAADPNKNFAQRALARRQASKYTEKAQVKAAERLKYFTKEASYDARNIANTQLFKTVGADKFMKLAGDGQAFANIDYGKADNRSYTQRDKDRMKKKGEDHEHNIAVVQEAMQDRADKEKKELLRRANDPEATKEQRNAIHRRIEEMDGGTISTMTPEQQAARGQGVSRQSQRQEAAENRLQQQQRLLAAQESAGNASGAAITRENIKNTEDTIKDAKNEQQRALLGGASVADREATIASLKTDPTTGLAELEKQYKAAKTAGNEEGMKTAFQAIQQKKAQIAEAEKELEKAKFNAKNKIGESTESLKSGAKSKEEDAKTKQKEIDKKDTEIDAIRKGETKNNDGTNMSAAEKKEAIEKLQGEKGDLQREKTKIEKEKTEKEDAVKAREEKKKELEGSLQDGTFLFDNATAGSYGKNYKELKDKYAREVDPDRRKALMKEMQWQNEVIKDAVEKGHAGGPPAALGAGASDADRAAYDVAMKQYTTGKQYFDMSMQKQLIEQVGSNKNVFATAFTAATIDHMQHAFGHMGETLGVALGGAVTGAVASTAAHILGGAPLGLTVAAALQAAGIGAGIEAGGDIAHRLEHKWNGSAATRWGYATSNNEKLIEDFREKGRIPGYSLK